MNRRILIALSIATCVSLPPTHVEAEELKSEIERVLRQYVAGEETQDPAAIMNLMSRSPNITSVTQGQILSGWTEIQRNTELAASSHKPPKISLHSITVNPLGTEHALALVEYVVSVYLTRGPSEFKGAWTVVFERTNGEWKILHEHHSDR